MRGYSEFMGYRTRLDYDAQLRSFAARRIDGLIKDGQPHEAQAGPAPARPLGADAGQPVERPHIRPAAAAK